jgi:hypothetical protein
MEGRNDAEIMIGEEDAKESLGMLMEINQLTEAQLRQRIATKARELRSRRYAHDATTYERGYSGVSR